MTEQLKIYKKDGDTPLFSGTDTQAAITGLAPGTVVATGDYRGRLEDGAKVSDWVDVDGFTVLPKLATAIVPGQKTAALKVGDTKNVTVAADPSDATDAADVIKAVTAKSSDDKVATVTANEGGGFDIKAVAVGSATITLTSGALTATVAVTVTAAA